MSSKSVRMIEGRAGDARRRRRAGERGAALATSLILLVLMGVIAASIVAVSTSEASVAGQDLQRMRTLKAAEAGLEHMTNKFSDLFQKSTSPTAAQLDAIAAAPPPGLTAEKFTFSQTLKLDNARLTAYRANSTTSTSAWPTILLPPGSNAFAGLYASIVPYKMRTTARFTPTNTEVTLEREVNSYLIPLFQFGMFSDGDIELHPGPAFTFNGRIHANGNIYLNGDVTLRDKVTTANEVVTDLIRNGSLRPGLLNVRAVVGGTTVQLTQGSAEGGPHFGGSSSEDRGYHPGSPTGSPDPNWDTDSTLPASPGVPNRFGGQIVTRSTGASPLKLPLQLGGHPTREVIKRRMPNDDQTLSEGRYHTKAKVRILIDEEDVYNDRSGIPAGLGVELAETSTASPYYFKPLPLGGGRPLWRVNNDGTYADTTTTATQQLGRAPCATTTGAAETVRGVKSALECTDTTNKRVIPSGAGIRGRVYIEVVRPDGTTVDVTRQILSLGMTVGEPNAILHFQRPMWAAFTQGSRDSSGTANSLNQLANIVNNSNLAADGEIKISSGIPQADPAGFLKQIQEDTTGTPSRAASPVPITTPVPAATASPTPLPPFSGNGVTWTEPMWNSIVPINVYNVREGWINSGLSKNNLYERGITQVVEVNMRNLARWLDGVYDSNLLAGTPAISSNIDAPDGYVIYFSDRRGDTLRQERDASGATILTTNGMVDNEDIYGPNITLDPGEDVIDHGTDLTLGAPKKGSLQRDLCELPNPAQYTSIGYTTSVPDRFKRARDVALWSNLFYSNMPAGNPCGTANTSRYFRRAVRLFNGENLRTTGAAGKLSATKGITFATENMLYLWGNYNTTGISAAPASGTSSLNDCVVSNSCYLGNQVPTSIVCDAIFPLSRTWFDALSSLFPEGDLTRYADANWASVADETSVRSGIVAGNNLSAMDGRPDAGNGSDSRLSGGMHNFPRFLENWASQGRRWNFTGSFVPLYRSTQALGQWNYWDSYVIYGAPVRNWSFDSTFTDPSKLPPGTPTFQYIEPTGFRQVLNY